MMRYVLCQDCLKVKPYTDKRHDSDEQCECGGDFCGCDSCNQDANRLIRQGEIDYVED